MLTCAVPSCSTLAPYRLRRHADYQRVYAVSRKYHVPNIAYFFRLRSVEEEPATGSSPRVGLTVPRALGNAVVRNRIKRRMREAVRHHLGTLRASPTPQVDVVLHPRKTVMTLPMPELEGEVVKLLEHVAKIAPHPQAAPPPRAVRKRR